MQCIQTIVARYPNLLPQGKQEEQTGDNENGGERQLTFYEKWDWLNVYDEVSGGRQEIIKTIQDGKEVFKATWIFGDRLKWGAFDKANVIDFLNYLSFRKDKQNLYK